MCIRDRVLGFMVFLIIKYRKKEGVEPADFDDNPKLELTWTILFAVILVGMAIPATTTMIKAYDDEEGDINILITGHQWKWQYEYMEDEVSFFSNLLTSLDASREVRRLLKKLTSSSIYSYCHFH